MVWNNVDPSYFCQLKIGNTYYQLSSSSEAIIRAKLRPFDGGRTYQIKAFKENKLVAELLPYQKREKTKDHSIIQALKLLQDFKDELNGCFRQAQAEVVNVTLS